MALIAFDHRPLPEPPQFYAPDTAPEFGPLALDLGGGAGVDGVAPLLARAALIRVGFSSFADGRGFSLAQRLRTLGYAGRLRALGPLIPDQMAYLRAMGFDEVELPADLLARQGGPGAWATALAEPPFRARRRAGSLAAAA